MLAVTKEKPEPVLTYTIPKIDEPDLHPEIPGLLFKQETSNLWSSLRKLPNNLLYSVLNKYFFFLSTE